ncbi:MAG: divalent metal cation transporter [Woeseiaceae bacterium]
MKRWVARLGPGLMLAAAAVGVSHLVFATQAGARFGLSLTWLIVLISVLKYPAFRFAVDYASLTDRSLVHAYARLGKVAMLWLFVGVVVDLFIATSAVSLVTAGLFISVFNMPFSGPQVAVGLCLVTALILINGNYRKAETVVKVMVLLFSVLTVLATIIAVPELGSNGRDILGGITRSHETTSFAIAMTGWMPMPLTGAIFISMWAREKKRTSLLGIDQSAARHDLALGWVLTIILALCFAVMGAAILFQTDRAAPASAGAFATELLSLFTTAVGDWSYPIIVVAAIAVMWSGVFALMDVLPRVTSRMVAHAAGRSDEEASRYTLFLGIQFIGVTLIMLFFMRSFGTFVAFATSAGFITAPALAWYNYRAIRSAEVADRYQPSGALIVWHWVGFAALTVFALAFVASRISG